MYLYSPSILSSPSVISTKRKNLKNPSALADDYNNGIMALAQACNQTLGLDYDSTTKMFNFTYPNNPKIKISIVLPMSVSQELGYGRITRIQPNSESKEVDFEHDIVDLEKTARSIIYDVGMATVTLVDNVNFQTIQFQNQVMGTLEPEYDGTMRMRCNSTEAPSVLMSYFQVPELNFNISRFSENSEPTPIMLPVGAYIQGRLVGKSIKAGYRC